MRAGGPTRLSKDDDPERTVFRPSARPAPSTAWRQPAKWEPGAANKAGAGWGPAKAPSAVRRVPTGTIDNPPENEPAIFESVSRRGAPKGLVVGGGLTLLAFAGAAYLMAGGSGEEAQPTPPAEADAPVSTVPTDAVAPIAGEPAAPAAAGTVAAPLPPGSFAFPGAPADAYAKIVQPACRAAIEERYPFFGNAAEDAAPAEVRRLFGPGGMLPSFVGGALQPLIATDGPVWRWRPGGGTAEFDPATPELLARLPALTALIGDGLSVEIEPVAFGGGVTAVELGLPGSRQRFDGPGPASRVQWRLPAQPVDSSLVLIRDGRPVRRYQEGGFWSPFRLIDKGRSVAEPDGATLVAFSDGTHSATLRLRVASGGQPFGRGGLWAFRCPAKL